MQISVEDVSRKILSREVDRQEAMRLFQSLDKEAQAQVLAIIRSSAVPFEGARPATGGRPLKTVTRRNLTDEHRAYITALVERHDRFVAKSKANVLEHQVHFVDRCRAFHCLDDLKKLHFQITYTRAEGAYVYDADGNKYIDISGDMGVNLFGHRAPFLSKALKHSFDRDTPLVGYSEMIFRACRLLCEITGHERALFTQSGLEAVMVAVRIARAATGRTKIVLFDGAGHGLAGAAVAGEDGAGHSSALELGILQECADQIIVLDYDAMAALDVLDARADAIAAVLVEPVPSRQAYKQPVEFIKALRQLTIEKSIPLIFDERFTGFRVCPRGAQGRFGIQADLAVYGGLPSGVIAGSAKYMDLIDGGTRQLDDDSLPAAGCAGLAGTALPNPLEAAAALAVLGEIQRRNGDVRASCENCTCFQKALDEKTARLAGTLDAFCRDERLPVVVDTFGSLFRFRFVDSFWDVTEALFFILLRMEGVATNVQGHCCLTTAHTDEDLDKVIAAARASLDNLKHGGFFREPEEEPTPALARPPVLGVAPGHGRNGESATSRQDLERLKALLLADIKLAEDSGI